MTEPEDGILQEVRSAKLAYEARRRPTDADYVMSQLVPLLASANERIVVEALNLLTTVGPAVAASIPVVRATLSHESAIVRGAGICALSHLSLEQPEEAVPDLLRIAQRPEHLKAAIWWLIHLSKGAVAAAPFFCEVAKSARDATIRGLAIRGLRQIGAPNELAVPTWQSALTDRSSKIRGIARKLLIEVGAAEQGVEADEAR